MSSWKELKDTVIICRNNSRSIFNYPTYHVIKLDLKGYGSFLVDPKDIDLRTGFVTKPQYDIDSNKVTKLPNLKWYLEK